MTHLPSLDLKTEMYQVEVTPPLNHRALNHDEVRKARDLSERGSGPPGPWREVADRTPCIVTTSLPSLGKREP